MNTTATSGATKHERLVDDIGPTTAAFGLSLAITSLFNAALVVLKETNEDTVLAWMKAATGHHWVTHGLLDLAVFILLGFALLKVGETWRYRPNGVIGLMIGGIVLGGLIITGFFL